MSPRRRKAEDADIFAAMVRVMLRVGLPELTLGAIAAEAGTLTDSRTSSAADIHGGRTAPRLRAAPLIR